MSSAWRCFSCTSSPSRHSTASSRCAAPRFGRRLVPGDTPPRDVEFVDRVERAHCVTREHVGRVRARARSLRRRARPRLRLRVEGEQRAQRGVAVGGGHERDSRAHDPACERRVGVAGQRGDDRVDTFGQRIVAAEAVGLGAVVQRGGHLTGVLEPAGGDDHAVDARGVDELAGGADADLAQPHDQDGAQRKSGPWSSRQPPLVGGTGPLLRTFTTTDTATAIEATSTPRWKAFMRRRV